MVSYLFFCLLESREGSALRSKHQLYLTSTANRGKYTCRKTTIKILRVLRAFYNNIVKIIVIIII